MPTLNWIGKDKVVSHHQDVPYRVLEHKYGFTADKDEQTDPTNSGNKIIHGDNLEALKSLLPEYEGKIKCIYIDPPYNTGNEGWTYNDNVNHPKIKKWLDETLKAKEQDKVAAIGVDDLTRHDKWLCMMYPRLQLLHRLLSKDGVIFISINFPDEHHHLKCICNEIFGENNYLGDLTWESTTQPINSGLARFNLQQKTEPILFYCKNKKFQNGFILEEIESGLKYPHQGKLGKCRFEIIEKSDAGDYQRDTMKFPILGQLPREGKRWQIGEDTAKDLVSRDRLEIVDGMIKKAVYPEDELDKKKFYPFWSHFSAADVGSALLGKDILNEVMGRAIGFDTVKPPKLIEELISHFPPDSIILDSFAGSGTTAHAVLNLNKQDGGNRKFILVEMEDYSEEITAQRVKRVMNGYDFQGKKKEIYKSYSVNVTNLKKSDKILQEYENLKKDDSYLKVSIESKNGNISIITEKEVTGKTEGLGGAFDFYELGLPLFDENENLNEEVGLSKIREYIWFSETRTSFSEPNAENYFLGKKDESAYYFIYEKDRLTTLDYDALELIKTKGEQYIIYADNCLLPKEFMAKKNIIFKKIPRDITRF
jgi:adenine-specific DNA-methyltransferase